MDPVAAHRQRVVPVGQRTVVGPRPAEREYGHRSTANKRRDHVYIDNAFVRPSQLKGAGVEGYGAVEGDGEAVDLRALGGAVVDDDALDGGGIDAKSWPRWTTRR